MRYRGRRRGKGIVIVAIIAALSFIGASYWKFAQKSSDLQSLVDDSELKNVSFEANITEIKSPQLGIKAFLLEDTENPIVSISFIFKNAGYASDNDNEDGIAAMTAALLGEGAGNYSAIQMKEELESRGIRISFNADKDDFTGALLSTKENLSKATKLLNLMLVHPRFDDADINRVKQQMISALLRQKENPNQVLQLEFNKELFGKHPYARNPLGNKNDILMINREKLQNFVKDNLIIKNLLVGVAGDVNREEAEQLLDIMFENVAQSGRLNFVRDADLSFDGRIRQIDKKIGQNITLRALQGVGRKHEDFYPLYVANYILGGAGLNSRLSQKIREENGLTYGVYSYLLLDDKAPLIVAGFASTADKYNEAEKIFENEWKIFAQNGVSQKELQQAKNYLTASNNLRFASIENVSAMLAAMQKYNLGLDFLQKRNDYINQIDLDDVNQVIKKYFTTQMVGVRIGSF